MNVFDFVIVLSGAAGIAGLGISIYINRMKAKKETFVCPAGFNCDTVVYSKYSKFLGIPVENIGSAYYLIVFLSYASFLFFPDWKSEAFSFFVISLTTVAFIFSVYLLYVQSVVLRQWCTWCLMSSALCTIIFISVWLSSDLDIIGFLNSVINSTPSVNLNF